MDLERRHRGAVGHLDGEAEAQVGGDRPQRRDRLRELERASDRVVVDHGHPERGGAELQEGGDLGHVGVADDHVEPAVLARVGVRLVAGVDDGPLQRRLEAHLLLEEVGALGDLEVDGVATHALHLGAHLAGTAEDLAGDEVRRRVCDEAPERQGPRQHVVLVAAVALPLAVGVVLVDDDLLAGRHEGRRHPHAAEEDLLAGPVVEERLQGRPALGRRQLGVRVVDVVAAAVGEHRVDEVRFDLGRVAVGRHAAAGVVGGRLVLEVPPDSVRSTDPAALVCQVGDI